MNTLIPVVILIVIAVLIFKSLGKSDPAAEQCAKEIIQMLRDNQNAGVQDMAEIMKKHGRTTQDADQVTLIVKTRLTQAHIRKEDHSDVMLRVRQAKAFLD